MCQGGGEAEGRGSEEVMKVSKQLIKEAKLTVLSVEGSSEGWTDARELAF